LNCDKSKYTANGSGVWADVEWLVGGMTSAKRGSGARWTSEPNWKHPSNVDRWI